MTSNGNESTDFSAFGASSSSSSSLQQQQHEEQSSQQQQQQQPPPQLPQGGRSNKKKSKNQRLPQQQPTTIAEPPPPSRSYQTIPGISTTGADVITTAPIITADASLRPNIGLTNRYADHALFGLALHTLLDYIRLACIANATACILLALLTWLWKLVTLRLNKLILLMYLLLFSFCLLLAEVWSLFPNVLPEWNATLQNQLGLLYHPPGKAGFLLVLATLCLSIGAGFWECTFALVYCACSFCLIHSWCLYPELRNAYADFNINVNDDDESRSRAGSTRFDPVFASWSEYAPSIASWSSGSNDNGSNSRGTLGERASLLYHHYQGGGSMPRRNEQSI